MWKPLGSCPDWKVGERLWHAGLSDDGSLCFLADCEDCAYAVISLPSRDVIWKQDTAVAESSYPPPIQDRIDDRGFIHFSHEGIAARFRIIGLHHNHPLLCDARTDGEISLSVDDRELAIRYPESPEQRFQFEADSGDWAYASFSEDGSVILVLEPYYATFFGIDRREQAAGDRLATTPETKSEGRKKPNSESEGRSQ